MNADSKLSQVMAVQDEPGKDIEKPSGFGVRHVQVLMLFLATTIASTVSVLMSLAIVAMTKEDQGNLQQNFLWNKEVKGLVLSSFFWGYVVPQVPSGALAARYGGKRVIVTLVAVDSVTSLLLPLAARYGDWLAVCACRAVQGFAQGFLYSAVHMLVSKWVPAEEKGRLGTFVYAGATFGTSVQLISSGFIADSWGWPVLFYVNGCMGIVWTAVYAVIGSESPRTSSWISRVERNYIENTLGRSTGHENLRVPWKSILTSLPVYSVIIAHFGQNWGFWTLITLMPSYMDNVLNINIRSNGVMSALPYIAMYVMSFPFGYCSDLVVRRRWLSITAARKLSNSIGFYGPALALVALSYAPAGHTAAVVALLTLVVGINAGQYTGYLLVHIDMAPNFAGILMGISNFVANFPGIVAPPVASALIQNEMESSATEWRKVFFLSAAVYAVCNTFFVLCGSSDRQPWNEPRAPRDATGQPPDSDAACENQKLEKAECNVVFPE